MTSDPTSESTSPETTDTTTAPQPDVPTSECDGLDAGIHCVDGNSVECDSDGNVVETNDCSETECVEDIGCVACVAGQVDCQGDAVVQCNTDADPPVWEPLEVCDPAAGEGCVIPTASCEVLEPIGDTESTGTFYRFANFDSTAGVFLGGYDVDSYGDRIYLNDLEGSITVYEVELLDSDGDGLIEPNQHPDDPANTGPIEERTIAFVETIAYPAGLALSTEELYVLDDRLFTGATILDEYIFASGALNTITNTPPWCFGLSQIAFDDSHGIWYASSEEFYRVMQHDAATDTWGLAFVFPTTGPHTDGLEMVTHPDTGMPYVYITQMSSTTIMQYRKDAEDGWVQENVFTNTDPDLIIEGMGFGALDHFWGAAGPNLIELGGGDMTPYLEDTPSP